MSSHWLYYSITCSTLFLSLLPPLRTTAPQDLTRRSETVTVWSLSTLSLDWYILSKIIMHYAYSMWTSCSSIECSGFFYFNEIKCLLFWLHTIIEANAVIILYHNIIWKVQGYNIISLGFVYFRNYSIVHATLNNCYTNICTFWGVYIGIIILST